MKNYITCFLLCALAVFMSGCGLAVSAHPTATGKPCHGVYVHQPISIDVNQVAIVGGDVLHPPCYIVHLTIDNSKGNGFDSAMLPGYYKELKLYSWYVPQTIGKPLTKSEGSINWQSKLFLRTNHDKV